MPALNMNMSKSMVSVSSEVCFYLQVCTLASAARSELTLGYSLLLGLLQQNTGVNWGTDRLLFLGRESTCQFKLGMRMEEVAVTRLLFLENTVLAVFSCYLPLLSCMSTYSKRDVLTRGFLQNICLWG